MITKLGKYEWDKAKDVPTNIQALLDDPETEITYSGYGEPRPRKRDVDFSSDNSLKQEVLNEARLANNGKLYHVEVDTDKHLGLPRGKTPPYTFMDYNSLAGTGELYNYFDLKDDSKFSQHYGDEKLKRTLRKLHNGAYIYKDIWTPDEKREYEEELKKDPNSWAKRIVDDHDYNNKYEWGYGSHFKKLMGKQNA